MKILILENNITDISTLNEGIDLAKQYALTIGLDLEFTLQNTVRQFTTYPYSNSAVGLTAAVQPSEILAETPPGYEISCLVYDWLKVGQPQPKNPSDAFEIVNGVTPMQIPIQWYATYPEVFAQYFLHELCHAESYKYGKTDITHLLTDSTLESQNPILYKTFAVQPSQNWYLYLLNALINVPKEGNLPPDDPSHMFNTQTGALNPRYTGIVHL